MDYELIWWIGALVFALLGLAALPIAARIAECKEYKKKHEYTEYHDDMEDWGH